jgi:hypothetical protein
LLEHGTKYSNTIKASNRRTSAIDGMTVKEDESSGFFWVYPIEALARDTEAAPIRVFLGLQLDYKTV